MTEREKFLKTARFELKGELFLPSVWQWFWNETFIRWKREGLPGDVHVQEYFRFQRMEVVPINMSLIPAFDGETLEEDATHKVIIDGDGAKKRVLKEKREMSFIASQWYLMLSPWIRTAMSGS
ncbi:MAG: hypothetical protein KAX20_01810 [Candidatus Omnitrophica bacterium]|nr:hypothetical protein [Candidatus Omnitrophota bacterium]